MNEELYRTMRLIRRFEERIDDLMVTDVRTPKMAMSTVKVDIVAVHVAPGDHVEADSIVVEVQPEKANFEVEAGSAGTVKEVLVQVGDEANVGDVIVRLEQ